MVHRSYVSSSLQVCSLALRKECLLFSALVSFKNVVSKFVHNGSSVFGCFLDANKAFDHVNHNILFSKLMERGIPPILNCFLLSWYKSQRMQVRWNATLSPAFSVTNGVRQGGVLSPIQFTIYMDNLLSGLKDLGIGCYGEGFFVSAACYADDVALFCSLTNCLTDDVALL